MTHFKKRIALFLCLMLVLPSILGCLPTNTIIASAAESKNIDAVYYSMKTYNNDTGSYTYSLTMEAGQTLKIGNLFYYFSSGTPIKNFAKISGETYTSSNTKVATVNKTSGKLTTKAKGTTNITIKYNGVKLTCKLKVVNKSSFGVYKKKVKISKLIMNFNSSYNGSLTMSTRYKAYQLLQELGTYNCKDFYYGFIYDKETWNCSDKLAVPEWAELAALETELCDYAVKNNPIGTTPGAYFKIKSVSAKANSSEFTINLKDYVNAKQIFCIQYWNSNDDWQIETNKAVFKICLQDTKTGRRYYGRVVTTKGSRKLSVDMDYLELVKGREYKLIGTNYWTTADESWPMAYKFTVK